MKLKNFKAMGFIAWYTLKGRRIRENKLKMTDTLNEIMKMMKQTQMR